MFEPKATVYSLLSDEGLTVFQVRPEVITALPCVTFSITDNRAILELNKDIGYQDIEVTLDFWANTSKETGEMLTTAEEALRASGFRLDYCSDVPDPDGISHITSRFKFLY